ncbi:MAG: DUF4381 domain-containing protein [Gammaproteobacteria bacterium]
MIDTSQLRDIELPPPVSWWPPAPGWWLLLLVLVLIVAVFYGRRYWQRWRARQLRRRAGQMLMQLRADYARHQNPQQLLAEVSTNLRRLALTLDSREQVAALTGQAWLAYLDSFLPDKPYQEGVGQVLATGPYQRNADIDAEALLALVERTVTAMTTRRRSSAC